MSSAIKMNSNIVYLRVVIRFVAAEAWPANQQRSTVVLQRPAAITCDEQQRSSAAISDYLRRTDAIICDDHHRSPPTTCCDQLLLTSNWLTFPYTVGYNTTGGFDTGLDHDVHNGCISTFQTWAQPEQPHLNFSTVDMTGTPHKFFRPSPQPTQPATWRYLNFLPSTQPDRPHLNFQPSTRAVQPPINYQTI